jgi:hypothetical protein
MITKDELKMFRKDFDVAVATLGKKYNVKVELGSISYDEESFRSRITCTKVTESGEKKVDTSRFDLLKNIYGLKADIGDKYSNWKGITFTIYDIDPKKSKYPVLVKGSDGKNYKASVDMINMHMAAQKSR